jgi:hypothetical protein
MPRNSRRRLNALRIAGMIAASLLLASAGCYRDTAGTYRAVTDKTGELQSPDKPAAASATQAASNKQVLNAEGITERDFGLKFYPGAELKRDLAGLPTIHHGEDGMIAAVFVTSDPVSRVLDFYRSQMPDLTERSQNRGGANVIALSEPFRGAGLHSVSVELRGSQIVLTLTAVPGPSGGSSRSSASSGPSASDPTLVEALTRDADRALKPAGASPTGAKAAHGLDGKSAPALAPASPAMARRLPDAAPSPDEPPTPRMPMGSSAQLPHAPEPQAAGSAAHTP